MLDLGHLKFTDSKHAVLGRDFVSVRNTNLRAGKWEFLVVVIVPVNDQFEVRASMQHILSREARRTYRRLNARKIPCDVSGRKKPLFLPDGPIWDANIMLKSSG